MPFPLQMWTLGLKLAKEKINILQSISRRSLKCNEKKGKGSFKKKISKPWSRSNSHLMPGMNLTKSSVIKRGLRNLPLSLNKADPQIFLGKNLNPMDQGQAESQYSRPRPGSEPVWIAGYKRQKSVRSQRTWAMQSRRQCIFLVSTLGFLSTANASQINILGPAYADHSLKMTEARRGKSSTSGRVW